MTPSRFSLRKRELACRLVDKFVSALPSRRGSRNDVLVVRLDAIGDFVLWLSAASQLRALYPGQRIVLAGNALWAPMARKLPYWDEVLPMDVGRLLDDLEYRRRQFVNIRGRRFSVAIQPTYSRVFLLGDSLVRISNAPIRIGAVGDLTNASPRQQRISDRWYTQLLRSPSIGATEIERNRNFLRELGAARTDEASFELPVVSGLPPDLCFDKPYFILFPGASWVGRQWPIESFAKALDALCDRYGWTPVLCGSANERALCESVAALASHAAVILAGKTSLPEFCEVVRAANLLIGNETSAVHIAAAVCTPSICLLGGGHFGRFVPYPPFPRQPAPEAVFVRMPCYGCDWNCSMPRMPDGVVPCIASITVDDVLRAAERALVVATPPPTGGGESSQNTPSLSTQ